MSSNKVYITLERLRELEFIEKNYSTIIANSATQVILAEEESRKQTKTVKKEATSSLENEGASK